MQYFVIMLLGLVGVQSFTFALFLLREGQSDRKTRLLGIFMIVIGLHFLNLILGRTIINYPGYVFSWVCIASYGPFIFSYVRLFGGHNGKYWLWIFTLPLYPLLLWLVSDLLHRESGGDQYFDYWVSLPVYASIIVFLLLSNLQIARMNRSIRNIGWLRYLVGSLSFLVVLHLLTLFLYSNDVPAIGDWFYIFEIFYMYMFITGMVYTALSRPAFFMDLEKVMKALPKPPKYLRSDLSDDDLMNIAQQLESHMTGSMPYLDPNLSLGKVSEVLNIPPRHISQALNHKVSKNFNDYVNGYRIREAIRIIHGRGKDLRIFEIMYDSGFNSKSSFNSAFKKYTGKTPTDYRLSMES